MNKSEMPSGAELIKELSLIFGPSGCEDRVRDRIKELASDLADEVTEDRLGNLICRVSLGDPNVRDRRRLMISAHMDEVGFMIDGITSEGLLTFGCIGGIDPSVLAGRAVLVGNEKKLINGVICSKAIHHKSKEERLTAVEADKLFISIGASSREEAERLVSIGDFGAFNSEFKRFGKDGVMLKCKALDDRMGCAAMLELMRDIPHEKCNSNTDVFFCFTVREEIGYSGASAAALRVDPDLALVIETTAIGDIPTSGEHIKVADVGKGAVISIADRATLYNREDIGAVFDAARKSGVSVQYKRYVSGGNDAGKIHKTAEGIRSVAISVPTRYLHSPASVANLNDYYSVRDTVRCVITDICPDGSRRGDNKKI